ncbi:MAG: hypothetical protein MZV64_29450 [Ignavibacteriales bacterium]|nr:hypothetical protein [Ignavibacteriales bacterium]
MQGIARFTLPSQNKSFAYLSIPYAQWIYSAPERLTSLSIMIDNPKQVDEIRDKVSSLFEHPDGKKNDYVRYNDLEGTLA